MKFEINTEDWARAFRLAVAIIICVLVLALTHMEAVKFGRDMTLYEIRKQQGASPYGATWTMEIAKPTNPSNQ